MPKPPSFPFFLLQVFFVLNIYQSLYLSIYLSLYLRFLRRFLFFLPVTTGSTELPF